MYAADVTAMRTKTRSQNDRARQKHSQPSSFVRNRSSGGLIALCHRRRADEWQSEANHDAQPTTVDVLNVYQENINIDDVIDDGQAAPIFHC
ncbi:MULTISPECIES: hypothetical protein [unclassified Ensifer]|jgi:hypothetical protein|uniref:hypothetical protein n=1 Tax=unclassified Ensifer TaxID=2633371 RepID=UPI0012E3DE21|nr:MULTISPECIES: hypothetical protein [unclassified Ensifer]